MEESKREYWNRRIHTENPVKFGRKTMEKLLTESDPIWRYEQDPYNTPAYKEGWERIFGKRDDIGSNLRKEE